MNLSADEDLHKVLLSWIESCKAEWKDNFIAAIQFGSTTKRPIKIETDVDLLLVFNTIPKGKWERFQFTKNKEQELELKLKEIQDHQLSPSVLYWNKDSFQKLHPLYLDFVDYSIILHDPSSLAKETILKTKKWMSKRGAKKIQKGQLWYWDVNPNNEPTFSWSFDNLESEEN